jgi:Domain of unknown function (DUF6798)
MSEITQASPTYGMAEAVPKPSRRQAAVYFLLGTAAFGLTYGQAPLYYSNQNQYFLHGLATAGYGELRGDWLANTADPTPIFSELVAFTYRFLHPWAFHVYHALLGGIYVASLVGLFGYLSGPRDTPRLRLAFFLLLLVVHSALARWASYRLVDLDYPWYLQAGVAGQYVLGGMFQPSVFGVLLILATYLFVTERPYWAVFSLALASTVHSTYLMGSAMLTVGFLYVYWREGQLGRGLLLGSTALLLVLPVTVFVLLRFWPTSPETFARAQDILTHLRIPHHSFPRLWIDPVAVLQIGWVLLGTLLCWRTRLFMVMFMAVALSSAFTLLQVVTGSDSLALLFPWRVSAVLVPIATAVILGRGVLSAARWLDTPLAASVSAGGAAALAIAGIVLMVYQQGFQSGVEEVAVMDFVKSQRRRGDHYLIPVQVPNLQASTRGSLSSDFKPVAAKKQDDRLIPVDLQRFRLYTGVPIFVDFKSIPYKDTDVLEWKRRLDLNQQIYALLRAGNVTAVLDELRRHRITHVVVTADVEIQAQGWRQVYNDAAYRVYQVSDGTGPEPSGT